MTTRTLRILSGAVTLACALMAQADTLDYQAGDQLPVLCRLIYGDPQLYLRVARANGIDNFRDIPPGTQVFFPPLEK